MVGTKTRSRICWRMESNGPFVPVPTSSARISSADEFPASLCWQWRCAISSAGVGNAARTRLDAAHSRYSSNCFSWWSSSRRLASRRQIRQSQSLPAIMTLLRRGGPFAKRKGLFRMLGHGSVNTAGGGRRRSFSGPSSLARKARSPLHKRPETEAARAGTYAATPRIAAANYCGIGRRYGQHKKGPGFRRGRCADASVGSLTRRFGSFLRSTSTGSDGLRFRFVAVEPAHGIGVNGPRGDLRGGGLLAFPRTLVGRTDQAAFHQNVRALPDIVEDVLRQARAEDRDPVPLGLRNPFVFGVFPRALRGDRKHGEFWAVALRLALLGIGSGESYDGYGIEIHVFLLFLPHFPEAPQSEGRCSQSERLHSGRDPRSLGTNRESRGREAAGRRNSPEAVPRKRSGRKRRCTRLGKNRERPRARQASGSGQG